MLVLTPEKGESKQPRCGAGRPHHLCRPAPPFFLSLSLHSFSPLPFSSPESFAPLCSSLRRTQLTKNPTSCLRKIQKKIKEREIRVLLKVSSKGSDLSSSLTLLH